MPAPAKYLGHGETGYWEPGLRKKRRIGDLDTLTGVYIDDVGDALMPGDAVPEFPGMIIQEADEEDGGAGSVAYRIQAQGNLDNTVPEKLIGIRTRTSLEPTWDSMSVDLYTTRSDERQFSTVSGSDHRFVVGFPEYFYNGDEVRLIGVTGTTGLNDNTSYYIIEAAYPYFKLADGYGAEVIFTGSASGRIVRAPFKKGTTGSTWQNKLGGNVYLSEVDGDEAGYEDQLPWKRLRLTYLGIIGAKPYKRTITVNGKTISSDSVAVNFPGGGWSDFRKGTFQQPSIEVTHLQVFATDPQLYSYVPTSDVFNSHTESRFIPSQIVIPNPPSINPIFATLSGADVVSQWPNLWTFAACEKVDEIPGTTVCLMRLVWRFEWLATL